LVKNISPSCSASLREDRHSMSQDTSQTSGNPSPELLAVVEDGRGGGEGEGTQHAHVGCRCRHGVATASAPAANGSSGSNGDEDSMDGGSSEDEEEEGSTLGGSGANQGVRVVKRLPFTRDNAETLMVETSDGELVDVEKGVATKMSLAIRKKIGAPPPTNAILPAEIA
jgi:hypothetical protein